MDRKSLIGIGLFLLVMGAYLTGVIEKLLVGDTMTYVKYGGGVIGSTIGILLIERGVIKERGSEK